MQASVSVLHLRAQMPTWTALEAATRLGMPHTNLLRIARRALADGYPGLELVGGAYIASDDTWRALIARYRRAPGRPRKTDADTPH
jgi:hypothetical protein